MKTGKRIKYEHVYWQGFHGSVFNKKILDHFSISLIFKNNSESFG